MKKVVAHERKINMSRFFPPICNDYPLALTIKAILS